MTELAYLTTRLQCAWCEQEFSCLNGSQLGAARRGLKVFCSRQCLVANSNDKRPWLTRGPCRNCGRMFQSQSKAKQYCSMNCYVTSQDFCDRMRSYNYRKKVERACPQCGVTFSNRHRKYCSDACRRRFFAERFDRFVANPEAIALPQCFDEFLMQDELPCLVVGCDWRGQFLGGHVNAAHGITAEKFKELCGFNDGTGLVAPALGELLSARTKTLIAEGKISFDHLDLTKFKKGETNKRRPLRLESKEHNLKARAIALADHVPTKSLPCRQCGAEVAQPLLGRMLYCNTQCRSKFYQRKGIGQLRCSYCGKEFDAGAEQLRRARKGINVACSLDCRNRLNITAALAARGIQTR